MMRAKSLLLRQRLCLQLGLRRRLLNRRCLRLAGDAVLHRHLGHELICLTDCATISEANDARR